MSEPLAGPATALLARKGFAAPVGAASNAAQAPDSAPVLDSAPARDLVSLPEVAALAQARAAPPASLMPHDFLPGPQGARDPVRDSVQLPPDRPDVAVVPTGVAASVPRANPEAKRAGETAAPAKVEAKPAPTGDTGPAAKPAPTGTAPPELSGKPEVPRPDPALRPALRPTLRTGAGVKPAARAEPRRFPALAAGLALALGAAGYGYQSGWFESRPPERPQAAVAAAVAPTQTQPEPAQPEPAQPEATDTALAPAGAPTGTPAESPPAAPSVPDSDPGTKADQPTGADQSSGAGQSSGAVQPSVDIVRIEPDGAAVIAGRAAPGVELIVLDNGAPIGTVAADAYGEWVFIPANPLPSGAHDFGLVIKEVRGGASVPAAGQAPAKQDAAPDVAAPGDAAQDATGPGVPGINEPGTVVGAAAAVPIPSRKPDTGTKHAAGVPSPAFVVQLASVKSRAGAQREWQVLRKRFPKILSRLSLGLDEAKLAGGDTVVRLRIGAFPKQAEAAALCARLAAKHQDCLVVRTTVRR